MSQHNQSAEMSLLEAFLETRRVLKTDPRRITHTSMSGGSYHIPDEELKEFHRLYDIAIHEGAIVHLVERHADVGPIVIDIDLRFPAGTDGVRQVDAEFVREFVRMYNNKIKTVIDVDPGKIIAFVQQRPEPYYDTEQGLWKDGLHIYYPYVITPPYLQKVIRHEVLSEFSPLLDTLGNISAAKDVLDECVIDRNGLLLPGSTKPLKEGQDTPVPPYETTMIVDSEGIFLEEDEVDWQGMMGQSIFYSLRRHAPSTQCYPREGTESLLADYVVETRIGQNRKRRRRNRELTRSELIEVETLVSLLSDERINDYSGWYSLGQCLYNIDQGLCDLWDKASQRSPKYRPGVCESYWDRFTPLSTDSGKQPLTVGSLRWWSKEDNFEGYNEFRLARIENKFLNECKKTSYSVARVMHELYGDTFVCTDIKNKVWFYFEGHRWHQTQQGNILFNLICSDDPNSVLMFYDNMRERILDEAEELNDPSMRAQYEEKMKDYDLYGEIIVELHTMAFKNNIMAEAAHIFYSEEFIDLVDENKNLFCFENGVLDLQNNVFRDGQPTDYISYTCGHDYVPYDPNDPCVSMINAFFSQIYADWEVREYMLFVLASCLEGANRQQRLRFLTGSGSNGKTCLLEFIQACFGDYGKKMQVSMLTEGRSRAGAASPEVVELKGRRFVWTEEPDENSQLNTGLLKDLSGGKYLKGRPLYSNKIIVFFTQFKILFACNDIPSMKIDGGITRRLELCLHASKFVENPHADKPNEYKIDYKLEEKMEQWHETFLSILVEYYRRYRESGYHISVPKCVSSFTDDFVADNNIFGVFFNKNLMSDDKGKVPLRDLYNRYQNFCINELGNSDTKGGINGFVKSLKQYAGYINEKLKIKSNTLYGYVLLDLVEADDSTIVSDYVHVAEHGDFSDSD